MMSDSMLKEILEGILDLKRRMNRLEHLMMELKIPEIEPTPEEIAIIDEYEKEKNSGQLELSKFSKFS